MNNNNILTHLGEIVSEIFTIGASPQGGVTIRPNCLYGRDLSHLMGIMPYGFVPAFVYSLSTWDIDPEARLYATELVATHLFVGLVTYRLASHGRVVASVSAPRSLKDAQWGQHHRDSNSKDSWAFGGKKDYWVACRPFSGVLSIVESDLHYTPVEKYLYEEGKPEIQIRIVTGFEVDGEEVIDDAEAAQDPTLNSLVVEGWNGWRQSFIEALSDTGVVAYNKPGILAVAAWGNPVEATFKAVDKGTGEETSIPITRFDAVALAGYAINPSNLHEVGPGVYSMAGMPVRSKAKAIRGLSSMLGEAPAPQAPKAPPKPPAPKAPPTPPAPKAPAEPKLADLLAGKELRVQKNILYKLLKLAGEDTLAELKGVETQEALLAFKAKWKEKLISVKAHWVSVTEEMVKASAKVTPTTEPKAEVKAPTPTVDTFLELLEGLSLRAKKNVVYYILNRAGVDAKIPLAAANTEEELIAYIERMKGKISSVKIFWESLKEEALDKMLAKDAKSLVIQEVKAEAEGGGGNEPDPQRVRRLGTPSGGDDEPPPDRVRRLGKPTPPPPPPSRGDGEVDPGALAPRDRLAPPPVDRREASSKKARGDKLVHGLGGYNLIFSRDGGLLLAPNKAEYEDTEVLSCYLMDASEDPFEEEEEALPESGYRTGRYCVYIYSLGARLPENLEHGIDSAMLCSNLLSNKTVEVLKKVEDLIREGVIPSPYKTRREAKDALYDEFVWMPSNQAKGTTCVSLPKEKKGSPLNAEDLLA